MVAALSQSDVYVDDRYYLALSISASSSESIQ